MIPAKQLALFVAFSVAGAMVAASAPQPEELVALAAKAQLEGPVTVWCRGEFESGRSGAYAIAVPTRKSGGWYLVLGMTGNPIKLAPFTGGADLSCYTPGEAKELNKSIARAGTMHGGISPTWSTTVVCGFVENTSAVCWQYSPSVRTFIKVGEWIT